MQTVWSDVLVTNESIVWTVLLRWTTVLQGLSKADLVTQTKLTFRCLTVTPTRKEHNRGASDPMMNELSQHYSHWTEQTVRLGPKTMSPAYERACVNRALEWKDKIKVSHCSCKKVSWLRLVYSLYRHTKNYHFTSLLCALIIAHVTSLRDYLVKWTSVLKQTVQKDQFPEKKHSSPCT